MPTASAWRESTYSGSTEALHLASKELVFQSFCCEVIDGPDRGQVVDTTNAEFSIGTAPGNDLRLSDPTVSGHHCVIRHGARGFELRDLGSTNGTRCGPVSIDRARIHDGARIRLGTSVVAFRLLDGEVREPLSTSGNYGPLFGRSEVMRRLYAMAARVAPSDATVLIEGETGTGKTLLAEAIHADSPRASGPFVVVDCGAIPATLIQSELYGHEKGAFTGALQSRAGAFECASGGTLFLDEVGELTAEMQPHLLRAIESRVISRVGSSSQIPVDVRIIAATNRDLRKEVNGGAFRPDLYYRLNTIRLHMPSLDERSSDIPELALHFYRQFVDDPVAEPPLHLLKQLERASWPGNVRELRSAVERAILLGDAWQGAAPTQKQPSTDFHEAKGEAIAAWEYQFLRRLIADTGGNLSKAARTANMNRNHLRSLLTRHGLYEGREATA
jgi:DNA-binding NtrC family response regulator